jgi:hypothetical protein
MILPGLLSREIYGREGWRLHTQQRSVHPIVNDRVQYVAEDVDVVSLSFLDEVPTAMAVRPSVGGNPTIIAVGDMSGSVELICPESYGDEHSECECCVQ